MLRVDIFYSAFVRLFIQIIKIQPRGDIGLKANRLNVANRINHFDHGHRIGHIVNPDDVGAI
jgi:hypothetical protein